MSKKEITINHTIDRKYLKYYLKAILEVNRNYSLVNTIQDLSANRKTMRISTRWICEFCEQEIAFQIGRYFQLHINTDNKPWET